MAQASGAKNVDKASFTNLDGGSGTFVVQFNPKELKLDEKASWKPSEEHGQDKPLLTYEKGEPTSLSMDLIFDTTDTGANVNKTFIEPLRDFMTAKYKDKDVAADLNADTANVRPCYCKFQWGGFVFDGVVEKVNATFLMFGSDGTPLRAKVSVGMKERNRQITGGTGGGVTLTAGAIVVGGQTVQQVTGNVSTYTVQEGDTARSIANKTGADERDIMHANNLPDPISLEPGEFLVIPNTSKLADVLSKQGKKENRGKWKDTEARDPFAESRAQAGQAPGPSALEETNPVGLDFDGEEGDFANAYISFGSYERGETNETDAIGEYGATGALDGEGQHAQHGANPYQQGEVGEAATYDAELGDGSIGEYGATGAGDGVGQHSQHGANPMAQGETGEAATYNAELGDGSIGEYGATGAGDGVGQHSQHGANPMAQGETGEAAGYDAQLGDGAVGEYGATGAGDGVGQHTQNGANPMAQGETGEAAGYDAQVGDGAVGQFGATGAGDGTGGHSQGGANPMAQGETGEAMGHEAQLGDNGNGFLGDGAGSGADGNGSDAIGQYGRGGAGEGVGDHSSGGPGEGMAGAGGRAGAAETMRGEGGGGGGAGAGRGVTAAAEGAASGGAGGEGRGPTGEIDIDTQQMREDNTEAEVGGPTGGSRQGRGGNVSGGGPGEGGGAAGGGGAGGAGRGEQLRGGQGGDGADVASAARKGPEDMTAKDVARRMAHKTGEKPENKEEVRRAAGAMGLGEALRQAKDNVDDNPSDE
jgi:LysM repeat protein